MYFVCHRILVALQTTLHLETEAICDTRAQFDSCLTPPPGMTDPFKQTGFYHMKVAVFLHASICKPTQPAALRALTQTAIAACLHFVMFKSVSSFPALLSLLQCTAQEWHCHKGASHYSARLPQQQPSPSVKSGILYIDQHPSTPIRHHRDENNTQRCRFWRRVCWLRHWLCLGFEGAEHHSLMPYALSGFTLQPLHR